MAKEGRRLGAVTVAFLLALGLGFAAGWVLANAVTTGRILEASTAADDRVDWTRMTA